MEDSGQPVWQLVARRHLVGDSSVANLVFCSHDPLRERRRGGEERLPDFLGLEPADLAQGQRDACVGIQRGMAAGEDEPQSIVGDLVVFFKMCLAIGTDERIDLRRQLVDHCVEARRAAQAIDRFEASGRDEPRARVVGNAVARPRLERGRKRIMQRLLCAIEVAEQTDERREHAPRIGSINRVDPIADERVGHR